MNSNIVEAIKQLPKVELHVHLDGSVRPATLIKLAKAQGKPIATEDEIEILKYVQVEENCENLVDYLNTFDFVIPYIQTVAALETVAYELVEQCAEQNVKYVEVRFAPHLHTQEGLSIEQIYEAVLKGLNRGEQKYNVVARCIGIILRGHDEKNQFETVEIGAKYFGKGLVAVDLAGAESLYPAALYEAPFTKAKQLSLPITIHAGEAAGADSIWTAVSKLHAIRIGHGVRLNEDEKVFNDIKHMQIPLEFCPISNIQTKAVSAWSKYPIKSYLEQGIKVTVNTDNLTVSNTNLTKELVTIVERCQLTLEDLATLQKNAIESIFLEDEVKATVQKQFMALLDTWKQTYINS